jgi:hypothetical protein
VRLGYLSPNRTNPFHIDLLLPIFETIASTLSAVELHPHHNLQDLLERRLLPEPLQLLPLVARQQPPPPPLHQLLVVHSPTPHPPLLPVEPDFLPHSNKKLPMQNCKH